MPTMLERVAVAICKSRTCEGAHCCQWPANGARISDCPVQRGQYDDAARDVLVAMRHPTDGMKSYAVHRLPGISRATAHDVWMLMIDEALAT